MTDYIEHVGIEDTHAMDHIVDMVEEIRTVDGAIETLSALFTKYPDYINAIANFAVPYIHSEIEGDSLPVVRWMVEHGWDPSTFKNANPDGDTLFEHVVSRGEPPSHLKHMSLLGWVDYIHELAKNNPTLLEPAHELNACETAIVGRGEGCQNDTKAWVPVVRKLIQLGHPRPRYSMLKEYCEDFEQEALDCLKEFTD